MNRAYPEWMNGDQLAAEAERRANEAERLARLDDEIYDQAGSMMALGSPDAQVTHRQTLGDVIIDNLSGGDAWEDALLLLACKAMAGQSVEAAAQELRRLARPHFEQLARQQLEAAA